MIDAVRMPLYFMLSGIFFKDYGGFFNLLEKKINKLFIPFLFFFLIGQVLAVVLDSNHSIRLLYEPAYHAGNWNVPAWFLICLFEINVIFCIIFVNIKQLWLRGVIVVIFGIIGYHLSLQNIYLPYYLGSAFTAMPFFFVGYLLRKLPLLYPNKYDRWNWITGIVILVAGIIYTITIGYTPHISFMYNTIVGNIFTIYILSIVGVIGLLLLCKAVKWVPIISYMGRYSIIILGLHFLIMQIYSLALYWTTGIEAGCLDSFLAGIILSWLAIPLMRNHLPRVCAQKDWFKMPQHK